MESFLDKYLYSWSGKYIGRAELTKHGIPVYSRNEEILNSITHFLGVPFGAYATMFTIRNYSSDLGQYGGVIFGLTMCSVYLASGIYHSIDPDDYKYKLFFRTVDRAAIFLLIAGTCTPFIMYSIRYNIMTLEWYYYATIWILALTGVLLLSLSLTKYKAITVIMYFIMSLGIFFFFTGLINYLPVVANILLLSGTAMYLLGFLFYGLGTKTPWMHTVFHCFCLVGSLLHGLCIMLFLI